MRFVGVSIGARILDRSVGPRPIESGYVPFGQVTGIVGKNDTGKSTLLRILHRVLDGDDSFPGVVFASCSPREFELITQIATEDLRRVETEVFGLKDGRRYRWWPSHICSYKRLEARFDHEYEFAVQAWKDRVLDAFDCEKAEMEKLLDEVLLADRPHIAFEPDSVERPEEWQTPFDSPHESFGSTWNVFWCLPPLRELDDETAEVVRTLGLHTKQWTSVDSFSKVRYEPDAPILLCPLGRSDLPLLPKPMAWDSTQLLESEAESTITRMLAGIRLHERVTTGGGPNEPIATPIEGDEDWLVRHEDGTWSLSTDVLMLVRRIETSIETILPDTVKARYEIRVRVTDPTEWGRNRLKFEAVPRDPKMLGRRPSEDVTLDLSDLADGFQLWLRIVILFSLDPMARQTSILESGTELLLEVADRLIRSPEDEALKDRLIELMELSKSAVATVRDPEIPYSFLTEPELEYIETRGGIESTRGRVLLIDEPERFLHPGLQREFVRWLEPDDSSTLSIVFATHSLPFMSFSGNARYSYLVREGPAPTAISSWDPRDLEGLGPAAEELGIDRGELMSLVEVVLWVEGTMDQVILETLFSDELRDAGVRVVPLRGYKHAKAQAILETTLLSMSLAKPAVWLDSVPRDYAEKLIANPEFARDESRKSNAREKEVLARIVVESHAAEREIFPVGPSSPGYDVFDLLDEKTIRDLFGRNFPGHEKARATWEERVAQGAKQGDWKNFWRIEFGVPVDEASCREIALQMRQSGRITEPLKEVVDQVVALSTRRTQLKS